MSDKTEARTVSLPAAFTEKTVDAVLDAVKECVDAGQAFAINGSAVERVDSAAVQALVVCLKAVDDDTHEAFQLSASELLAKACQTAGVVRAQAA